LGNVERAGLRPYLDALAQSKRGGGAARLALAEAALPTDPLVARKWLRYLDDRPLIRLLELEDQKRIPVIADGEEIEFWAGVQNAIRIPKIFGALAQGGATGGWRKHPDPPNDPSIDCCARISIWQVLQIPMPPATYPGPGFGDTGGARNRIEACSAHPAQSMPLQVLNVQ
jgi:hypothetical protein